jgi:nitrite reductase/ring-hydroxylating ferredoxin subunit/uncharacterized membrane protein
MSIFQGIIDAADRQAWLDPIGDALQQAVSGAYSAGGPTAQQLKNFLHGIWLGHPLHPVLTDVPLGAWTVALALDGVEAISGRREAAHGADAAVALGLVGAVGAAITGLTDWQHTDGRSRRIGLAHGLLNGTITLLYTASLRQRQRGERGAGRGFAALGFAVSMVSAYLGGDLVYEQRIGVSRVAGVSLPQDFVPVLPAAQLLDGEPRRVEVDGVPVVLVRRGSRVDALVETCSHMGGPLAEGRLEDGSIRCPWHGSRFALDNGRVLDGPATFPQPSLETRVRDGQIEVRAAPR